MTDKRSTLELWIRPQERGYLEATNRYDSIGLLCVTENTDWVILRSIGNIAYV